MLEYKALMLEDKFRGTMSHLCHQFINNPMNLPMICSSPPQFTLQTTCTLISVVNPHLSSMSYPRIRQPCNICHNALRIGRLILIVYIRQSMDRERREYTPTKLSKLTNITNNNPSSIRQTADYSKSPIDYVRPDYARTSQENHKSIGPNEMSILKQYQLLKMQVRQMESQNRQLSNEIQKLKYEKNINETKYHQKVSSEEEAISQFQKEKNYQIQLLKIKNDEDIHRLKREFDYKKDQLHRELKNKDYHNRELKEKISYMELKSNELRKGIQILQTQHIKVRQSNAIVKEHLNQQEFNKKKLLDITEELERQKTEMESEIHVLLDIEAEKSRTINTLEIQLRNSENTEKSLHEKLSALTDNFASLEQHITIMKERLISTDLRNEQLEKQLHSSECQLSDKDHSVMLQKELEVQLRKDLEIQQRREVQRQKQLQELIAQNQRLVNQVNANRQRLHDICITQGIQI